MMGKNKTSITGKYETRNHGVERVFKDMWICLGITSYNLLIIFTVDKSVGFAKLSP